MRTKIIDRNGRAKVRSVTVLTGIFLYVFGAGSLAYAARSAPAPEPSLPSYALVSDFVTSAPDIATVIVRNVIPIPPERAPGLAAGKQRLLISVETQNLIRSKSVLARQASFLIDLRDPADHKPPRWKGRIFLIFGRVVPDHVNFFQLQSSRALLPWSPEIEAMVRHVVAQFAAPDSPPAIRDITSVFHVGGAVEGEGETQIFLETTQGDPISLSIVRRPDEKPQFGAALGEIIDEAAALPAPNTPLWYRLACGLPKSLPAASLSGQTHSDAVAAERDYEAFLDAMAPCDRMPPPIS